MRRAVAYTGVFAALLTVLLPIVQRLNTLTPGLTGAYSTAQASASSALPTVTHDVPPFSSAIASHWRGGPPDSFSATWTGQIWIPRAGRYTFAVNADKGTSLFVDGQALFDNVRHPEDQFASNVIDLGPGAHTLFITYTHFGGDARLDLLWGASGDALTTVPASALQPRRAGVVALRVAQVLAFIPIGLGWIWAAVLTGVGVLILVALTTWLRDALVRVGVWSPMRWILVCSIVLNTTGFWWGLPAEWVPIELTPSFTLDFIAHHFANGWFDAYPPLQYYFLSVAISPMLVLHWLSAVVIDGVVGHTIMMVVFRSLSLVAAVGTVVCACLTTVEAFGRRAGLFAAGIFALTAPFVFYAKTANVDVPYIFWFAASMVLFVRIMRVGRLRDFVLFAAAAACAVCTKDQAYGFYVLVPFAVVARMWSANRRTGTSHPLGRVFLDPRIIAAAATAAACFAIFHNLLFNFSGFMQHMAFITGPGSQDYRVYAPTLQGRWALLVTTLRLIGRSMGWPMFVVAAGGAATAIARRDTRATALWLFVPVISYYVFFIDVVLYNYDRFVIPICFGLAPFAGLAIDRMLASRTPRSVVMAGAGLLFAYTLVYCATVDYLMLDDSRYAADSWMHAHIGHDLVAVSEFPELLPSLDGFRSIGVQSIDQLDREKPKFFILNADYARAAEPGSSWAKLIEGLEGGHLSYRTVARFRNRVPWTWLPLGHPDLIGPRDDLPVFSVMRDINPTIEIYERQ